MITKSRVTGAWALEVLESFRMDRSLPKFAASKPRQKDINSKFQSSDSGPDQISMSEDSFNVNQSWEPSVPNVWMNDNGEAKTVGGSRYDIRHRFVDALSRLLRIHKRERTSGTIDPLRILLSVRGSLTAIRDYVDRVTTYDAVIQQAKATGQKARMEHLLKARQTVQFESMLLAAGFKQYLSEAQVIDFALKCQKGLRLDWITNFTRPIPLDVASKKAEADALKVFDNYVILHYDPKGQAFALTAAQEKAKKDPILFGMIDGVRKLYFIGDWKDDECDLTMAEIATVLGNPASEIGIDPTRE